MGAVNKKIKETEIVFMSADDGVTPYKEALVQSYKAYAEQDLQIFSRCATALLMTMDTNTNLIDRYLKILLCDREDLISLG
jgi:hypothetical protein